jgi:hypothetical protein
MAKGKAGADSSVQVIHQIGGKNLVQLAQDLFGTTPVLWGRYFAGVSKSSSAEYRHLDENQILRQHNIRVLPIAQQTPKVGGTQEQGRADAMANVEDLFATFGKDYLASQGGKFLMFLDVEGSPSLSLDYYMGWAGTVVSHSADLTSGGVQVLPCVYATQLDTTTWQAIASASDRGVGCNGAWVAHWVGSRGCQGLVDWDNAQVSPRIAIPCQVLLWQYSDACHGEDGFDCNQTNPGIDLQADLLAKLVLPPETSGGV